MELTFGPRGMLRIDDARIMFRNFEGRGDKYNREGDRNFALVIPTEEMAQKLVEQGWNVKIKDARDDGEPPFMFLKVKVKFNDRGPVVYLNTNGNATRLDEDTIECLDHIDIDSIDMDIRPYDWELSSGATGRTAYLQGMDVVQRLDRFAARYAGDGEY